MIDVSERVRKLEVMASSLTVRPKGWEPTYDDSDTIARHLFSIAPWNCDQTIAAGETNGFPKAWLNRPASFLRDKLDEEGFGPAYGSPDRPVNQDGAGWTLFLIALHSAPRIGLPSIEMVRFGDDEPPYTTIAIGGRETSEVDWWNQTTRRWTVWHGLATGKWAFATPGHTYSAWDPGSPDLTPLLTLFGVPITTSGCYVLSHGGAYEPWWWVNGMDTAKWVGANWDGDPSRISSCENTQVWLAGQLQWVYGTAASKVGAPWPPDPTQYAQLCKKFGQQWVIGGQSGFYVVLGAELWMGGPPLAWSQYEKPKWAWFTRSDQMSAMQVLRDDYECPTYGITPYFGFPGWQVFKDRINGLLEMFPGIQAWYDTWLPIAKAEESKNRQWMHVNPGAFGSVEVAVRDKHVYLNGTLRRWGSWNPIGALCGFTSPDIPPPAGLADGNYMPFPARTKDGRDIQLRLGRSGNLYTFGILGGQEQVYSNTYTDPESDPADYHIVFDDVRWATDQDVD